MRVTNNPAVSLVAGTALAVNLLGTLNASTGVVDLCSATLIPIGQTMQTVLVGENQSIRLFSAGTLELTASGAITKNAPVWTDASGKITATPAAGSRCVGIALDAATADGDVIGVLPAIAVANEGPVLDLATATATTALTVSTGGSATTTLAAGTNTTSLTDNGGGAADNTVTTMPDIALSTGGGNTYSDAAVNTAVNALALTIRNNVKELTTQLALQRTLNGVLLDAITSLGTEYNKLRADFADLRAEGVEGGLWI